MAELIHPLIMLKRFEIKTSLIMSFLESNGTTIHSLSRSSNLSNLLLCLLFIMPCGLAMKSLSTDENFLERLAKE